MGELGDLAKKQSKFFMIEIGETVEVTFLDYRIIPSQYDPEEEIVQYKLSVNGKDKFWTNGSQGLMKQFDSITKNSRVKISRLPMLDAKGQKVENKSIYKVEKI